ncbi:MAG: hypothetical protein HY692_02000 [Cyanobacteria bacterium NC_groundwater_1444_Ag_S-0.65um_54_12]|nr:hypothetical protein [Cyanobacteria bacterium NC_groundwater_1444_Ag_S-0.65um_54_12]
MAGEVLAAKQQGVKRGKCSSKPPIGKTNNAVIAASIALDQLLVSAWPAIPTDRPGKEQWLRNAKARLARIEKQMTRLQDGWFKGDLSFDAYVKYRHKAWELAWPVAELEQQLALSTTKPEQLDPVKLPEMPEQQVLSPFLTPRLLKALQEKPDSLGSIIGTVLLPLTLMIDGMYGLSIVGGAVPGRNTPDTTGH